MKNRMLLYANRRHGGRMLASALRPFKAAARENGLVLALPRGGVPVAYEVARRFGVPLDVLVVRKLGVPAHEELAMGALASGGIRVIDQDLVVAHGISADELERVVAVEQRELERRERAYRGERSRLEVEGKLILLVDDGLATGSTMRAALAALRQRRPKRIVVGVPVASWSTCELLRREADDVVCVATPERFGAVSAWYQDFSQTSDEEVCRLLEAARKAPLAPAKAPSDGWVEHLAERERARPPAA
jgi:putative phosphoribosyl transferase